jgi:hypothetical protein
MRFSGALQWLSGAHRLGRRPLRSMNDATRRQH